MLRYFAERGDPQIGRDLAARIYRFAETLKSFPHAGRSGLIPGTREFIIPNLPYFLAYRVNEELVEVLRVMHTSRFWRKETTQGS
ncbi:MAG: type II toxin-antitoxin system RelE/ParE family toxin [Desulfovibrionaceae bacterium]|jgi:plasmid stabilization system protein ParE